MNAVAVIAKNFTEESKVIFTDGTVVEGAEQVAKFMLGACEAYNKGYMKGLRQLAIRGVGIGLVTYVGIKLVVNAKKNPKI